MTASTQAPIIRDAVAADLPRLLELLLQLSESSSYPETATRPISDEHHAALERIAADPGARLVVLEAGGWVLGTLTLYVLPNLSHGGRPFAVVENVVVDATLRGGGHGRLLMAEAVRIARAAGCYKVSLTSNNRRGPAHAFYERNGFAQTHRGFTFYLDDDKDGT